jgi:hypothetical protein
MPWGRPRKGGWSSTAEGEPVTRFSQVIRTVLSVMPGGVIRYGKDGPDDDAHTGFWLGVTGERVARFSVGGPAFWLKWTGSELLVRGKLSTLGGDTADDRLRWVGVDAEDIAYLAATDAWGHQLEIGIPRTDMAADPGQIDLFVDGDLGASVRLRLCTERDAGVGGSKVVVQVGTGRDVFEIDGNGNVWARGVGRVADAAGETDAVNRRTGDIRYVLKEGGWSGTVRTNELRTITVVNGQVTGVE